MTEASPRSLTNRAFSGAFWTASGWGLSSLFQLVFGLAIARLLGPTILGVYAAALIVIRLSNLLGAVGIGPALVQRRELSERHVRSGWTMSLALSLAVGAAAWVAAPALGRFFRMPDLPETVRLLAFVFPARGLAIVPRALLQRALSFRQLAAIETFAYAIGFGVTGVTLALVGFGINALVVATLCQAVLELVLLSIARPYSHRPGFSLAAARDLLRFGGGVTVAGVFGFLAFQGDKLVVGRLLGDTALGLYSRAYSLMSISTKLYSKIASTAAFPLLSRVQMDEEKSRRALRRGLALNALSVLPLSAMLFVIAPELIQVLLGDQWVEMTTPFRILVLFLAFRGADKLCGPFLMSAARVYSLVWIQAIFAGLVLGGAWLGSAWGLNGVAGGVATAIVLHSLLLVRLSLRVVRSGWAVVAEAWVRPLAVALLTAATGWATAALLRQLDAPAVMVVLGVSLSVLALIWIFLVAFPHALFGNEILETLRHISAFRRLESLIDGWLKREPSGGQEDDAPAEPTVRSRQEEQS